MKIGINKLVMVVYCAPVNGDKNRRTRNEFWENSFNILNECHPRENIILLSAVNEWVGMR